MPCRPLLAIVPARGGSKGLPRKNLLPLAGLPLLVHSLEFAKLCPEIDRCIVSTEDEEIAATAKSYGGDVPFMRPSSLALDSSPTWPVLQHALRTVEEMEGREYEGIVLLEPTSPARLPEDMSRAFAMFEADTAASGIISVSEMPHHPAHVCVKEKHGSVVPAFPAAEKSDRRQDLEKVFFINGLLYVLRRKFVLQSSSMQIGSAPHRMLITDAPRAIDIDDRFTFDAADILIRQGFIKLPWLQERQGTSVGIA